MRALAFHRGFSPTCCLCIMPISKPDIIKAVGQALWPCGLLGYSAAFFGIGLKREWRNESVMRSFEQGVPNSVVGQ